jgi:hypothetical protein
MAAIASQLAGALDAYESEVASMAARPEDLGAYRQVSERMDQMRLYAGALPELSVPWAELLIRHFEFTHGVWQLQQQKIKADALEALRAQHHAAVVSVSARLRQLVALH